MAWGFRGKGCRSKQPRGPIGDLAGSPWVDSWPQKLCGLGRRATGNFPLRPGSGSPTGVPSLPVFHLVCPAPRLQLTQRRLHERTARLRQTAAPARVPRQRALAGRHRPACPLAPGDWRLDDGGSRAGEVIGCNPQSLNEPGKGGATSGRDTTAKLSQGHEAPSLACFVLFTWVCSSLLRKLRVHDYKFSATNRPHTFGDGRILIPVGLGYGSFRYH